jgi:hypothetical protein
MTASKGLLADALNGAGRTEQPPPSPGSAPLDDARGAVEPPLELPLPPASKPGVAPLVPLLPLDAPLVPLVPLLPLGVPLAPLLPASAGATAPVTMMLRSAFATPSPPVPAPLAAMPATHIVIGPFLSGAMNESLYVPVPPLGGGATERSSDGSEAGSFESVFIPFSVFTPSLNATFSAVRALVPATTSVTSFVLPACTLSGTVSVSVGAVPPLA